ncbi:unnamed protein product [Periconia digitata]|uniref:Uncharacterized protein n=1 Tax=Periconia digitata TaxID=1303443 RepID=A0A9W4XM07_9PLEO|nr:unnamed protein product [Periconia digitata]
MLSPHVQYLHACMSMIKPSPVPEDHPDPSLALHQPAHRQNPLKRVETLIYQPICRRKQIIMQRKGKHAAAFLHMRFPIQPPYRKKQNQAPDYAASASHAGENQHVDPLPFRCPIHSSPVRLIRYNRLLCTSLSLLLLHM